MADAGESNIVYCDKCDYAASDEKAELLPIAAEQEEMEPLAKVATPDAHTIELLVDFLKCDIKHTIKAVAFQTEKDEVVLAFVRGDHDVNEVKVINAIGAIDLHMAEEAAIREVGGMPGFMSPIGIKKGTKIVVDTTVMNMYNAVSGANEVGMHYTGVNPARDFDKNEIIVTDIRLIKDGDPCPRCGGTVHMTRGIEAGQVFTLGTKYSKALHATYLDEQGKEQLLMMGCYGIGVSRTMAAAIEQCNDKDGIIWPRSIAPYEVVVVPVNAKVPEQLALAEEIYEELKKAGVDTIIDDRKERWELHVLMVVHTLCL